MARKPGVGPAGVHVGSGMLVSKEMLTRQKHLDEIARPLNVESAKHVNGLKVIAQPVMSDRNRRATFRVRMGQGDEFDFSGWAHRLGDYLFNARALLDNIMWAAATTNPTRELTDKEKKHVYFPVAETEDQWKSFANGAALKVAQPTYRDRIEAVQPFRRPEAPTSRGMLYLHRLHRVDKHQVPLTLHLVADPQWPMLFDLHAAGSSPSPLFEWDIEWLNEGTPLVNRMPLVEVRTNRAMKTPKDGRVPLALVAELGGDRYDLQDLLWDITGAVMRAVDTVCLDNTFRSDLWDADIAFQRERLAASTRSVIEGTDEWFSKYGDGSSPMDDVYDELRAAGAMEPKAPADLDEESAFKSTESRSDKRPGSVPKN